MLGTEGFPKFYHGLRYSLDFSITQMTSKFVIFDLLMAATTSSKEVNHIPQTIIFINCILANIASTFISQSAFNYQIIASSLPIDKNNRDENVRIKLRQYTKRGNVPLIGIRYTIPVTFVNTIVQIFMIKKASEIFKRKKDSFSYFA